ncbi:MAG: DUF1743 domain-containing protein [Candidatus Geothermarchaeales archaeon]
MFHIGFDDTDSKEGMCTTYIGAVVVDEFKKRGIKLIDFPHLIRLNPNWTLKTRGNCAIAIRVDATKDQIPTAKKIVLGAIQRMAELHIETTNPGVAFYEGASIPLELKAFSKRAIQDIVTLREAEELAEHIGAEIHKFKLGRGVVGALAAIGETLEQDRTFELIAYRTPENRGTKRRIDEESVLRADALTHPETFDNLDPQSDEIRITPHTPCPLLYGIRGESPDATLRAHGLVRALEPIERWVIYKTNQGTDAHLKEAMVAEVKPLRSVIVKGIVSERPKIIPGGHVIFKLRDQSGEIDCAAYEPTRQFRRVAEELRVGDQIKVYGGVKRKLGLPLTINLEKIEILNLKPLLRKLNPLCPECGRRAKSAGREKGYVCKRCGLRLPEEAATFEEVPRMISPGLYEVPPRARRHLAKPLIRVFYPQRTY